MKIAVLGTGYVGLVSGVGLAERGHDVTCVDLRTEVVENLNLGIPHIHEDGLQSALKVLIGQRQFRATCDLEVALQDATLVLIAVGTPSEDGHIDLQYIERASIEVGLHIKRRDRPLIVVVKSTIIPGTTDTLVKGAIEKSSGKRLGEGWGLGMNPEFLREGSALSDFRNPDRIVFGYEDPVALEALRELYSPWECEKVEVNTRTAELIKYANNCLLATQISAVNELANLAAAVGGIDVMDVMKGVHLDKRWNPIGQNGAHTNPQILSYLVPGCGFGGSCFPKDLQAIRTQGASLGRPMQLLQSVLDINSHQPTEIVRLASRRFASLKGLKVVVLGLAFKPDTDDVRESASRAIISGFLDAQAKVVAHDPVALSNALKAWSDMGFSGTIEWERELETADIIVVATRWPEYKRLTSGENLLRARGKLLIDARRFFHPKDFPESTYLAIGFNPITSNL